MFLTINSVQIGNNVKSAKSNLSCAIIYCFAQVFVQRESKATLLALNRREISHESSEKV